MTMREKTSFKVPWSINLINVLGPNNIKLQLLIIRLQL